MIVAEPLLGSLLIDTWSQVCDFWPRGEIPEGYHDPVVSDKPVLVLSGELDPVTPPRWGAATAEHLSNSLHIVVPGAAHGTSMYGCVPKLIAEFVEAATVDGLDAACVDVLERPMFFHSFTGPRVGIANEGVAP
jgi:pimeloyl-ACP methyl ester carboxylesterase